MYMNNICTCVCADRFLGVRGGSWRSESPLSSVPHCGLVGNPRSAQGGYNREPIRVPVRSKPLSGETFPLPLMDRCCRALTLNGRLKRQVGDKVCGRKISRCLISIIDLAKSDLDFDIVKLAVKMFRLNPLVSYQVGKNLKADVQFYIQTCFST